MRGRLLGWMEGDIEVVCIGTFVVVKDDGSEGGGVLRLEGTRVAMVPKKERWVDVR